MSTAKDSTAAPADTHVVDFAKRLEEMHTELAQAREQNKQLKLSEDRLHAMEASHRKERDGIWKSQISGFMGTMRENSKQTDNPDDEFTEADENQIHEAWMNTRPEFRGFHNFIAVAHKDHTNSRSQLDKMQKERQLLSDTVADLPAEPFKDGKKRFRDEPAPAESNKKVAGERVSGAEAQFGGDDLLEAIFKDV
jgi:hypothetical protein